MSMRRLGLRPGMWLILILMAGGVAMATSGMWWLWGRGPASGGGAAGLESAAHEDHEHGHGGGGEETSIELSSSALRNIGYRPMTVERGSFTRTATLPAMVIERPGRSLVHVTAPLTGLVTAILPAQGAAVEPGDLLFVVRLTHEEIVATQRDLLRTVESLEVVNREIERLNSLSEGIVAGKRVLEQEYERKKLEASLAADRQALVLHGLTEEQVDAMVGQRRLLQSLEVRAPDQDHDDEACEEDHLFHVQELPVKLGQQVEAGAVLCVLADHCELYIEGQAFAGDAERLRAAARQGWEFVATAVANNGTPEEVRDLQLMYLSDRIDPETRAFRFYLALPNQVGLDRTLANGQRFIDWKYKPGQRMELRVPIERWEDCLVLPVQAVIEEGAEAYVYRQNGRRFERRPVTIEYRDRQSVVVANDGSLFAGDVVAARGAYQMHLALKNKSGGAVDPHAGHSH